VAADIAVVLAAIAVGISFALLDEVVMGLLAATPWPRWYVPFARAHKHLGLELWRISATLPIAAIATVFGFLLARLTNGRSMALPCMSIGVWALYMFVPWLLPAECSVPLRALWEDFLRFQASSIVGIVVPTCTLLLGFRFGFRITTARGSPT